MMFDPEPEPLSEIGQEKPEYRTEGTRSEDMQRRLSPEHSHSGQQPEKSEKMVAVNMRETEYIHFQKRQSHPAHLHLRTLTAVYQKQAPTYIKYLSARISVNSGQGRSRAQYIQSEVHPLLTFLKLVLEGCKSIYIPESRLLDVGIDLLDRLLGAVGLGYRLAGLHLLRTVCLHM